MPTELPRNVAAFLQRFELFEALPPALLERVVSALEYRRLRAGETLVRQNEPSDGVYLVLDGRLDAVLETGAGPERLPGTIGRGEVIGEMALLTGESRSCSVVASRAAGVVHLPTDRFWALLGDRPETLLHLARSVAGRARGDRAPPRLRTVAVVSLQPEALHLDFARELTEALGAFGSAALVTGADLGLRFDSTATASMELPDTQSALDWLARVEADNARVVYLAHPWPDVWTRRCLAQADLVLLVAAADAKPDRALVEHTLLDPAAPSFLGPTELVLLQRGPARGTAAWLAPRAVRRHHHVAGPAGVRRLARLLTGNGLCLVLGGGGARSFAHLGILAAFQEAGVES
ncbi:MAG: cyclic nucleotide-binding domain-containing protein, partial [Myxococcales bacterium]|nr:cyclic nucleotide-binding domain-containing protein [Myxococcales bacterium]